MAEVQWIKIVTDVFDNRKIRMLESMPDGDSLVVIWFKLLCMAGKINDGGLVYITSEIPYTEQSLATIMNRPLTTVQLALAMFEKYGMIQRINDFLQVSSWTKYQNVEGMDKIRAQTRKRVAEFRGKQKALPQPSDSSVTCNVTVTQGNATDKNRIDKNGEDIKEKEVKEKETVAAKPLKATDRDIFREFAGEDTALLDTLRDYEIMRNRIKRPLTLRARELVCKELLGFPEHERIPILEQSIKNSWQGIFPLKKVYSRTAGASDKSGLQRDFDMIDNWLAGKAANCD